jgi:DNA repair exonuclease SbcCD ATPase subunit
MNQLHERNGIGHGHGGRPGPHVDSDILQELEALRSENGQLRSLCVELEQALQEATQHGHAPAAPEDIEERFKEYETLLEEKSETIRDLHQQLQQAQAVVADLEGQLATVANRPTGPTPREEELLALSEELERDRRQLQEDEQTLMEQMREMEISMARERAELARQRNDLVRLQQEIHHELERLEKSGTVQSKLEALKSRFIDATARRGMAQTPGTKSSTHQPVQQAEEEEPPAKKEGGLFGRLFGRK